PECRGFTIRLHWNPGPLLERIVAHCRPPRSTRPRTSQTDLLNPTSPDERREGKALGQAARAARPVCSGNPIGSEERPCSYIPNAVLVDGSAMRRSPPRSSRLLFLLLQPRVGRRCRMKCPAWLTSTTAARRHHNPRHSRRPCSSPLPRCPE